MALKLGETAPNFQAETSQGPIDFYQYLGDSWGVLFRILLILHLYAQLNLARSQNLKRNLINVIRK